MHVITHWIHRAATVALLAAATTAAATEPTRLGAITIESPWVRLVPPVSETSAGYMTLRNAGTEADRLLAAAAPVSKRTELHTHVMEGGLAKMRQVDAVEIPAGGAVSFAPGGLHIMLIGLARPLDAGESIPVTLTFERAGRVEVVYPVQAAPMASGGHGGHGMGHGQGKTQ
ncbi:MAG: copper chaperone PCu(A)C [Ectothiorhodospiraceae bacterium]|nr:copper chaperone PCu(A)C [Chromatiales bacterium]MCP5154209.1 copper chaperone PCu(A)C [Ectothiorhodospiraceae bacterium]